MKRQLYALLLIITSAAQAVDVASLVRNGLVTPETLAAHHSELGLTSEQEAQLKSLVDEAKQQYTTLDGTLRGEQQKLEAMLRNTEAKHEVAAEQLKKLIEVETTMKLLQLRTLLSIRAALTPEQQAKAVALMQKTSVDQGPVKARIKAKADKLKEAFDTLGIQPSEALKAKGAEIEKLASDGDIVGAEKALDTLIADTGLDEPAPTEVIDFGKFETGSTDLSTLQERYKNVDQLAREVIRLPTIRLLLQGRDELEKAKSAEDAERVARILTWAEGVLAK